MLSVEKIATANLPTETGDFKIIAYRSLIGEDQFVALVKGRTDVNEPTVIDIRSQCFAGDVLRSTACDCRSKLNYSLRTIGAHGRGVIVYRLANGNAKAVARPDESEDSKDRHHYRKMTFIQLQQHAEILRDLGLRYVRLLSNSAEQARTLELAGLIVEGDAAMAA